ncbi:MAG: ammonium transporter [Pseudomonadales bacterium]|jgi:ammonium transporter, Amt family|nr:ammonium transporter [Pseudomonadales bacterium]MDP4765020.1 ammonium transporter [Pseudomonadales bacterium]MDP4874408.1 ammonium transporter [Pseudomonadales bacterium]MDP4910292.1 ammonium transporter [Pseudomonadales bacterium]MDP5058079.1 ammonium transporter [Pseudomonadales bacterium]
MNKLLPRLGFGLLLMTTAQAALADDLNSGNTAWILTSTALVLFMTLPGLALFYGGLVRTKNVLSVLMQCFAITCVVSVLWLVGVYSMAFAEGNDLVGGLSNAFMANLQQDSMVGDLPESVFAMFQLTFAIITPALIVGAFAERMRFASMLLFSALWLVVVYGPVTHWVWGGGWLQQMGLLDFAGGTVVHVTAGVAALVCALYLGPRKGFPKTPMPPHNMTMVFTGAAMLWVGWFGFNGGSALAANGDAGMAMLVTHMSAAAGALTWMACEWYKFGRPSALGAVTGMVAGLGTITPASGFVGPAAGLAIGMMAGIVCFNMTMLLKQKLHIDDSLDVFPVHGIGGALGTILAGIFASSSLGIFSGQGYNEGMNMASQLQVQVIGVLATGLYAGVCTLILLKLVDSLVGLRVSPDQETEGLDINQHNERGYDL